MRLSAKGGTDGANIVLFWPDNMPEGIDSAFQDDPVAVVDQLRKDGRLIWFPCDGDGEYSVAIFVRSEIPADLLALYKEEERIAALVVRGTGYFGGMEYIFKNNSSFLAKYPQMCGKVDIQEGTYSATIFTTDVPEKFYDGWLLTHAGATAVRLWNLHGSLAACSVIGVIASLLSLLGPWVLWWWVVAITVSLITVTIGMSRTSWYKAVATAQDEFGRLYPSYVVHLE